MTSSPLTTPAPALPDDECGRLLADFHELMERHGAMRRINERWVADPAFRAELREDPGGTLGRYHLEGTAEDVRSLLDGDLARPSPAVQAMWQVVLAKTRWVERFYRLGSEPADPVIQAWRRREVARQRMDLGPFPVQSSIQSSLAIELSTGCSQACWFCGLSPARLSSVYRYSPAAALEWRETLEALAGVLGPATRTGFLYWATDPFDNPDYERFCTAFASVIGTFPPTTTALALRDPERTRSFLRLSRSQGCWLDRFSVVGLRQLTAIHATFSAADLARVECLPLNRQSMFVYGNAGRFRERAAADPGLLDQQRSKLRFAPWYTGNRAYADSEDYPVPSIGCVTGFLLSMSERTVQVITPVTADEQWPTGNRVHFQAAFDRPADLPGVLGQAIGEVMAGLEPADRLWFPGWLRITPLADGFAVSGRFRSRVTFRDPADGERALAWRVLGDMLREGGHTAADAAGMAATRSGIAADAVWAMLGQVFDAGVLDRRES